MKGIGLVLQQDSTVLVDYFYRNKIIFDFSQINLGPFRLSFFDIFYVWWQSIDNVCGREEDLSSDSCPRVVKTSNDPHGHFVHIFELSYCVFPEYVLRIKEIDFKPKYM